MVILKRASGSSRRQADPAPLRRIGFHLEQLPVRAKSAIRRWDWAALLLPYVINPARRLTTNNRLIMSGNLVVNEALFAATEQDVLRVQAGWGDGRGRSSVCYPRPMASVNGRMGWRFHEVVATRWSSVRSLASCSRGCGSRSVCGAGR
jgi:hypothetical protein